MEFKETEYSIYGAASDVAALTHYLQEKQQMYENPLEGLPLECMADDTGVIAKGMITHIQYLPDAVTLQVVGCTPMVLFAFCTVG